MLSDVIGAHRQPLLDRTALNVERGMALLQPHIAARRRGTHADA